jgi:hypothetical protein
MKALRCDVEGARILLRGGTRFAADGFKAQSKIDPMESAERMAEQCFARMPDGGFDLTKRIEAQEGERGTSTRSGLFPTISTEASSQA